MRHQIPGLAAATSTERSAANVATKPYIVFTEQRIANAFTFAHNLSLQVTADVFNLINKKQYAGREAALHGRRSGNRSLRRVSSSPVQDYPSDRIGVALAGLADSSRLAEFPALIRELSRTD
jgi:hypothetical protein